MFYLEKLDGETPEQVCVWCGQRAHELYPELVERYARFLEERPHMSLKWPGVFRAGEEICFGGKTFCLIETFSMTIRVILRSAAENGAISRDVITVAQVLTRETFNRLSAGATHDRHADKAGGYSGLPFHAWLCHGGLETEIDLKEIDRASKG